MSAHFTLRRIIRLCKTLRYQINTFSIIAASIKNISTKNPKYKEKNESNERKNGQTRLAICASLLKTLFKSKS